MIEITNGIYLMPLPLVNSSLGHINTYLLPGKEGHLLVDCGWNTGEAFASLKSQMAEIGTRPEDISQIVVTHIHPDHYGLAGKLKQLSQAKIALHHLEKEIIETRYVNFQHLLEQLARWLSQNGTPTADLPVFLQTSERTTRLVTVTLPDVVLHGGETITAGALRFQVLWTPGHSPGHISLYEPDRKILLCGDYILPSITPHISLNPYQVGTSPLDIYLHALEATRQLEADLILPGHQQPFHNLQARIEEIVWHHGRRNSEILNTVTTEKKTAYQIATELTWMSDTNGVGWEVLSPLDRRLAVLETLSHLESMRLKGIIHKSARDGLLYYHSAG